MRIQALTLAAASAALLAPTTPPPDPPDPLGGPETQIEAAVSAADLLAKVRNCTAVSQGRYRSDSGTAANIPVCGRGDAVFWKADMDIDCDGQSTGHCNSATDPYFSGSTAFQQSDGRYLSAEHLPYIVVPTPSGIWDYRAHGIRGGSVAAVVYGGRVQYAVVGDVGPRDIIGEASYATAKALGIPPDPRRGGTQTGIVVDAAQDAHGPAALGPHFVNIGRLAQPEEQAAAIVFLASDAASNINGAILPVDDGWAAV